MKHYIGEDHIIDHQERTERGEPFQDPSGEHTVLPSGIVLPSQVVSDLEQKLAAMVDERLASLARRVDLLYRYTVGDRTGRHTLVPNMHQRGEEFPEAVP